MTDKKNIVIHFTDGSKVAFDFPYLIEEPTTLMRYMEQALNMPYIVIEADGAILLYPRENIKSIQLFPAPQKLGDFVIKGATFVDV